jgi:hypothetical protein
MRKEREKEGRGIREEGRGKREEGRGRENEKKLTFFS